MPNKLHSKRRITSLLSTFSNKERKKFVQFLNSSFFNTDQTLIQLFVYLDKIVPPGKDQKLTGNYETETYTIMFGKPASNSQLTAAERAKLNDKFSRLTKLGLDFLTHYSLESDSLEKTNILLKELYKKKLTGFFRNNIHKKQALLKKQPKDVAYYHQNYQLERSLFEFQFRYDINKLLKTDNLGNAIETLDIFYVIDRMILHLANMAILSNVGTKKYDFQSIEKIIKLTESFEYQDIPVVRLCRAACYMENFKWLSKTDPEKDKEAQRYCKELIELLLQYENEVSRALREVFFTLAINFCSHQTLYQKNDKFQQIGFKLYHQMETKGLMSNNNRVSAGRLTNGVAFACHSGNYDWAEIMFKKYLPQIDKQIRVGISTFIPGQIAFYRGDFEKADLLFLQTEQQPFHRAYTINCNIFRLKCLYELNQYSFEAAKVKFNSEVSSRKKRKGLSKVAKESQINYIKILMQLYKIRDVIKIEPKPKLINRLNQTETKLYSFKLVSDILWLEKKIQELKRRIDPNS